MSLYETVFILRQELSESQVDQLANEYIKIIQDHGSEIVHHEYWGLRTLAYKIKKNRKGHYIFLTIDGDSVGIKEVERRMRLNEDVLRFMTVKVKEKVAENTKLYKRPVNIKKANDNDAKAGQDQKADTGKAQAESA